MADKKEHGPHPFALLREWRLALNPVIEQNSKTELEAEKLINLLTDILLHSPTLNAQKIEFTVAQSQLLELQGCSRKTLFNQLKKLNTYIGLSWEQPKPDADGKHKPSVFVISKNTEGNKTGGKETEGNIHGSTEGNKWGVTEGNISGKVTRSGQKALVTSGHSSGQTGIRAHSLRSEEQHQPQEQVPDWWRELDDDEPPVPVHSQHATASSHSAAPRLFQVDED